MSALSHASGIVVTDCLNIQPHESVLIVTDEHKRTIAYAIWEAAKQINEDAMIIEMAPRSTHGEEPPKAMADLMQNVHVIICPTSKSLTHTDARRNACTAGARVATLPGITEDMMVRTMSADYYKVAELSNRIAKYLHDGKIARITSSAGTDITLPIDGMTGFANTGLIHEKGASGNLPAGEAFLAPVEGKSNGVIVIDGSMAGVGQIGGEFIKITVKDGFAEKITGGDTADRLAKLVEPHGKPAYNVAELGIGTNDKAKITGLVLEDEKVIGTVHIALGDNISMGGTTNVASHLDGIISKPTVYIDDELIMEKGEFMV